ncbi:hypothetical protein DER61_26500 [Salmonella enterica]|nr:hypothetical protein [Salmonella enterica]
MKKIIAIAALTASSLSCAYAATPANSPATESHAVISTTQFIFDAQQTTVAPVFTTQVLTGDAMSATTGTALAKTSFKTNGTSTSYKVVANYAGENNDSNLEAAFSINGTTATPDDIALNDVSGQEDAYILLLKKAALNAGTTTVTYTITGYNA